MRYLIALPVELEGFCALSAVSPDCDCVTPLLGSAFSPDDRHVVLVAADGQSSAWGVWDTTSGSMVPLDESSFDSPPWPTTALFSPDGSHLYLGGNINAATVKDGGTPSRSTPPETGRRSKRSS